MEVSPLRMDNANEIDDAVEMPAHQEPRPWAFWLKTFFLCCDGLVWRPSCPYQHSEKGRAARWVAVWALLAGQEEDFVEVVKDVSEECFSERIIEQTVEIAGFRRLKDATSAAATAVGESAVGPRPSGIAKRSASTESVVAVSLVEAGSSGPGLSDTTRVAATAVAKPVVQARPPGFAKYIATTESVVEESLGKLDLLGPETVARPAQPFLQQMQNLLPKLGHLRLRSRAPRQNPKSLCLLVKMGLLDPEQVAGAVPALQQS